jgi:hypothetical protein
MSFKYMWRIGKLEDDVRAGGVFSRRCGFGAFGGSRAFAGRTEEEEE